MRRPVRSSNRGFRLLAAAVLLLLPAVFFKSAGQFYSFGEEPFQVKWREIKTDNFNLIYPAGMDSTARHYLQTLEMLRPAVNEAQTFNTTRIPVVLHPYETMSNGSVSWAPKVVHLITSPNPYSDTQIDWEYQLAAHELRHVAQTEQFSQGFFKWLYPIFGEQIVGLGVGLFASSAYLEGDAVISETELSEGGRGRDASFLMQIRADYLNGVYYNYERSSLGSYYRKAYDKYAVGYMMLSAERMRTGDYFYSGKLFHEQARLWDVRSIFYRETDRQFASRNRVLDSVQSIYTSYWKADLAARGELSPTSRITPSARRYCDYKGAVAVMDTLSPLYGSLLAVRSGMDYTSELVRVDPSGKVHRLRAFGSHSSKLSDCAGGRVYWSETVLRNSSTLLSYSEIRYYDVISCRSGSLTCGTRYFNPAASPDGRLIAAAEYPVGARSRVVLLSSEDGRLMASCPAPSSGQVQETAFCGDELYATVILPEGVGIWKAPVGSILAGDPQWAEVIPTRSCEIRSLRSVEGRILFASDFDGVMNIYSTDGGGAVRRETNSEYGVNYPFAGADSSRLYFSEYDRNGYHLASMSSDSASCADMPWDRRAQTYILDTMLAQRAASSKVDLVRNEALLDTALTPSKRYSKFLHAFHVHSWAPVYYNVDRIMNMSADHYYDLVSLGATVYSQNTLGTLTSMLGYSYHNGFHSGHAMITGKVLNCDLSASFDYDDRKQRCYQDGVYSCDSETPFWKASVTVDYPLNLYNGGWQMMIIPSFSWGMNNDKFAYQGREYLMQTLTFGARFYRMLPVTPSGVYPRWGFSVSAYDRVPVGDGNDYTNLTYVSGYAYFPGITRAQGLKASFMMQHHSIENRSFYYASMASLPRGYENTGIVPTTDYLRLSADYAVPIPSGDIAIPYVLYIKRFQLIPFADYALDINSKRKTEYFSYGGDLLMQFNVFRLRFEFTAGVRFARTLDLPTYVPDNIRNGYNRNSFSFLFGMNI